MLRNTTSLGLVAIFGWCVMSAIARVITGNATQEIEPSVLCFYTFLFAMVIFLILNFSDLKNTLVKCKERANIKNVLWLNITTFGAWFFLMYPLKFIDPAIVSTITLGLGPLATLVLGFFIYKSNYPSFFDVLIALLLFLIILFIIYLTLNGVAIRGEPTFFDVISAITSCFIVGFTSAAGNLYAKKLSDNKFKPTAVLIARFPLIILLAAIISLLSKQNLILTENNFIQVFIVSGSLVIIPLYLAQLGIKHLDPIVVAVTAPLMPVLVFIIEYFNHRTFYWAEVLAVIMTCLLILFSTLVRYRKIRVTKAEK